MGDETDSESIKLRMCEPNNEKPPPNATKPIQLKIHKNWKELVCRRIYILSWIQHYDQTTAVSDLIAGVTLGLTMIPQAIAYAALAQLPSHYGLYAAFIGMKILNAPFAINCSRNFDLAMIINDLWLFLFFRGFHLRVLWNDQRSIDWSDIADVTGRSFRFVLFYLLLFTLNFESKSDYNSITFSS